MTQRRRVELITDVPETPEVQFRRRRRQYLLMMGLRIALLILAAVLVSAGVPHALWWVGLCIVGMVALPWMAVLIANDRPPRQRSRFSRWWQRRELPPSR